MTRTRTLIGVLAIGLVAAGVAVPGSGRRHPAHGRPGRPDPGLAQGPGSHFSYP